MSAYAIANIEVIDPTAFEAYRGMVSTTIEKYGGRYLVRGGALEVLEGVRQPYRLVVLEFPSAEQARSWYDSPEYRPARELRIRATRSHVVFVDGTS